MPSRQLVQTLVQLLAGLSTCWTRRQRQHWQAGGQARPGLGLVTLPTAAATAENSVERFFESRAY